MTEKQIKSWIKYSWNVWLRSRTWTCSKEEKEKLKDAFQEGIQLGITMSTHNITELKRIQK